MLTETLRARIRCPTEREISLSRSPSGRWPSCTKWSVNSLGFEDGRPIEQRCVVAAPQGNAARSGVGTERRGNVAERIDLILKGRCSEQKGHKLRGKEEDEREQARPEQGVPALKFDHEDLGNHRENSTLFTKNKDPKNLYLPSCAWASPERTLARMLKYLTRVLVRQRPCPVPTADIFGTGRIGPLPKMMIQRAHVCGCKPHRGCNLNHASHPSTGVTVGETRWLSADAASM